MKLSIIMPVYNEIRTIEEIIRRVKEADTSCTKELILVDDASTDGTREFLKRLESQPQDEIKALFHEVNKGKGAAIRTGLQQVSGDLVLIQDADTEYDPSDYNKLLEPILKGYADAVFGNRFHGGPHRVLYFWHSLGNRCITTLSNILTNLNLSDMEVGYKIFRTEVLKKLNLRSNRFGFEPEVTVKLAKLGCRIYEVPISYHGRTYEEGKKITWRDGIVAIYCLIRYYFFD
ncbi:MAG: glycosyltransferase family 2 protein [Deltaproteobacteria bacterium]|nr:glycosyltransferase family 2 protein [Deltaproteobacteria bacterium]